MCPVPTVTNFTLPCAGFLGLSPRHVRRLPTLMPICGRMRVLSAFLTCFWTNPWRPRRRRRLCGRFAPAVVPCLLFAHWRLFRRRCLYIRKMAGAAGIEPANGGTKNRCLTAWLRPIAIGVMRPGAPGLGEREATQDHGKTQGLILKISPRRPAARAACGKAPDFHGFIFVNRLYRLRKT